MCEIKIEYKIWYRFKSSKARNHFLCSAIKQYEGIDKAIRDKPIYGSAGCLRVTTDRNGNYSFNYRMSYNAEYMTACILYDPDNFEKHRKETIKNMIETTIDAGYGRMDAKYVPGKDIIVINYYDTKAKELADDMRKRRDNLIKSTDTYKLINAYIKDMTQLFNNQGRKEKFSFGQDIEELCAYEIKEALLSIDKDYKEEREYLVKNAKNVFL